jgi:hypothetical protein
MPGFPHALLSSFPLFCLKGAVGFSDAVASVLLPPCPESMPHSFFFYSTEKVGAAFAFYSRNLSALYPNLAYVVKMDDDVSLNGKPLLAILQTLWGRDFSIKSGNGGGGGKSGGGGGSPKGHAGSKAPAAAAAKSKINATKVAAKGNVAKKGGQRALLGGPAPSPPPPPRPPPLVYIGRQDGLRVIRDNKHPYYKKFAISKSAVSLSSMHAETKKE